jgi:hypothetical protein
MPEINMGNIIWQKIEEYRDVIELRTETGVSKYALEFYKESIEIIHLDI